MHLSDFTLALAFVFLTGFRFAYRKALTAAQEEGNSRKFAMWASLYDALTLPATYLHELSHMLTITLTGGQGHASLRTRLVPDAEGQPMLSTGAAHVSHTNSFAVVLSATAPLWLLGTLSLIVWTQLDFKTLLPAPLALIASALTLAWVIDAVFPSVEDWALARDHLLGAIWFVAGFVALGLALHALVNYKPAAQAPASTSASASSKVKHVPTKLLPAQPKQAASKVE